MTSSSTSHNHCSAINCSNRQSKRPDLSFFRFPKNKERCEQWIESTCRNDLLNRSPVYLNNNCHICADHFEEDQFSNRATKNRLKWNAVPTFFNVPDSLKTLSNPHKIMKRKRCKESKPCALKQQKENPSPLVDHSYCKPNTDNNTSSSSSSSSVNSSNRSESLASPYSNDTPSQEEEKLRTFRMKKQEMNKTVIQLQTASDSYVNYSNTNSHSAEPLNDINMPRPHMVFSLKPLETPSDPYKGDSSFLSPLQIKQEPCEETTLPQQLTLNPYSADDYSVGMTPIIASITASTVTINQIPSPSSAGLTPDSGCESSQLDFATHSTSLSSCLGENNIKIQNVYSVPIDFPTMVEDNRHVSISHNCLKTLMSLVSCPVCQAAINHEETIQGFKAETLCCLNLFCYNGHCIEPRR